MEFVKSEKPVARKMHFCEVCGWRIEPGEQYERSVTFDAGTVSTWKSHRTPCATAADRAWMDGYDDCGFITSDAVAEWADEHEADDEIAAELNRRLRINSEHARKVRASEIREGK